MRLITRAMTFAGISGMTERSSRRVTSFALKAPACAGGHMCPERAAEPRRPSRRYPARSPGEGPPCSVNAPGALPMHLNRAFMCNQGYHGQRVIIE